MEIVEPGDGLSAPRTIVLLFEAVSFFVPVSVLLHKELVATKATFMLWPLPHIVVVASIVSSHQSLFRRRKRALGIQTMQIRGSLTLDIRIF